MGRISFEEKLVLVDALQPKYDELKIRLNEAYKNGTQKEIDAISKELGLYNDIKKKMNLPMVD